MRRPPAEALRAAAVPHGVLIAASGRVAIALVRPSGEVVVHRRRDRGGPASSGWRSGSVLRGLLAWGDKLQLLGLALWLSYLQLGGSGALAPAMIDLGSSPLARGSEARLRWRLAACVLAAAASAVLVPVGIYRGWRLVWADGSAALQLAVWRAAAWGLGALLLALAWRLREMRRWRMHHAAAHKVLLACQHDLPLQARAARHMAHGEGACSCEGLGWFLVLSGLLAAVASLLSPVRDWTHHLGAAAGIALGWGLLLAMAWDLGQRSSTWEAQSWGQALAWPGRWLRRRTLEPPDAAALEVALVALRAVLSRDADASEMPAAPLRVGLSGLADACARGCSAHAG